MSTAARADKSSRWSWRLGAVRGIDIRLHATFLLLIGWVAFSLWSKGMMAVLDGVAFILTLFGCVVLHELGHALTAQRFGIVTRDITLLPIGGVARLEKIPEEPRQELWVALAGPAVNVVIAAILFAGLAVAGVLVPSDQLGVLEGPFLQRLAAVNVVLAVFNMIPAFPMDGGRVLRAVLAGMWGHVEGTRVAAGIGKAFAAVFGLLGMLGNPVLLLIAVFVWVAAGQEATFVHMRALMSGALARDVMITQFRTLAPVDSLAAALHQLLAGTQEEFPVSAGEDVVGVLTREDLMDGLEQRGEVGLVGQVMHTDPPVIDALAPVSDALAKLQGSDVPVLVTHRVALVGLITRRNLAEFIAARDALESHVRDHPRPGAAPFEALGR